MIYMYSYLLILNCVFALNTIRVLFVNEEINYVAEKSVEVVTDYIKKNPQLGIELQIHNVVSYKNESSSFLSSLCSTYNELVSSNSSPHIVFDTTKMGYAAETTKYFTLSLGLATISTSFGEQDDLRQWRNLNEQQKMYLIQIKPPSDMLTDIIRPMVIHQKIPNAAIFHDDTFDLKHKLKSLLLNYATRHTIFYADKSTIHDQLLNARRLDIANFFILGNFITVQMILKAACDASLLIPRCAWHVISTTQLNLTFTCPRARFMLTAPKLGEKEQERMEILKKDYKLTVRPEIMAAFYFDLLIHTVFAIKNMQLKGIWPLNMSYITCEEYNYNNTPSRPDLNIRKYFDNDIPDTPIYGTFVLDKNGKSAMQFSVDILGVEFIDNVVNNTKILATWDTGHEYNFTIYNETEMKTYINEKFFKVVTVEQKPFIFIDKTSPRGFRGYYIDLMDDIAHLCNFNYDIHLSSDGTWGSLTNNGTWTGGIRDLVENKAELGIGALSVLTEREAVVDFSVPVYDPVGFAILMKNTRDTSGVFKFLTVLEGDVWICIFIAYVFTSLLMYIFDRISPFSYQNCRTMHLLTKERRIFNFFECAWFCMTSLTPQGGGEAPKCLSGCLLAATWWLFGFIIIASYTANLAAFLTVSRLDTKIENLDDLANQYRISYAPVNGSQTMIYFQRMAEIEQKFLEIWKEVALNDSQRGNSSRYSVWEYPISSKYTKLWFSMLQFGLPFDTLSALERVRSTSDLGSGFAFLGDASDLKYLKLTNCDLQIVGEEFSKKPYAIAVQKGHPLKEQIDNAILTLVNRRRLTELKDKWWTFNPEAARCEPEEITGINIQNIAGVFIVVLIGTTLAIVLFICDIYFKKYLYKRK